MNGHERGQQTFLHQGHANGGADADLLECRRFLRRQFLQIVIHHERLAGSEIRDCELAKIGQAIVADNVKGIWSRPVTADREAVLVRVHVGIGAAGYAQMLADHARGDCQDRVCIGAFRRLLSQCVEKL